MLAEKYACEVGPFRQRRCEREHREKCDEDERKAYRHAGRHAFGFEADEEGDSDCEQK